MNEEWTSPSGINYRRLSQEMKDHIVKTYNENKDHGVVVHVGGPHVCSSLRRHLSWAKAT